MKNSQESDNKLAARITAACNDIAAKKKYEITATVVGDQAMIVCRAHPSVVGNAYALADEIAGAARVSATKTILTTAVDLAIWLRKITDAPEPAPVPVPEKKAEKKGQ